MNTFRFIGRAFRYPNYRIFFAGQFISLLGTWLQLTALPWLVYRLTGSSFLLGVVGFLSQIPAFFLTPFAGVLIDRMDRRHLMIITQAASMVQAIVLWVLLVSDHMSVTAVLILSFVLGIINAFDIPARQTFTADIIEHRSDLGNAIALNASMVHGARLIGPTIAGVLIGVVGEASCFLLNALSFMAVIVCLLKINIKPTIHRTAKTKVWNEIKDGVAYVGGNLPMREILFLIGIISLTGMPYMVFMPVFAKDIFQGTANTLGLLVGASGLGALAAAMYLASREGVKGYERILASASCLFGISLMAFALSKTFILSWVCMVLVGFGMMILFAASNTILQTIVDDRKRGIVMSLYTISFMGMTPLGNLVEGYLSDHWGVSLTIFAGGLICVLASLNFLRHQSIVQDAINFKISFS